MEFQTVIYNPTNGAVVRILPGQYIKSRAVLDRLCPSPPDVRLKFFYYNCPFPLSANDFRVLPHGPHRAPALRKADGSDPTTAIIKQTGKWLLDHYNTLLIRFEGGMGDYLDQADVVTHLMRNYPDKNFSLILRGERAAALKMLEGFSGFKVITEDSQTKIRGASLKFSEIDRLGGDYPPGGKVGVYSAIAGLNKPAERARIVIPEALIRSTVDRLSSAGWSGGPITIGLHTMSGNTNTKSIRPGVALELLAPLLDLPGVQFLQFGGAGEERLNHPRVVGLQGALSWPEVFAALSLCDACICIDSAILHIAQHLNIPTLSLWGPTSPAAILAADPGVTCLVSTKPCAGCARYECDHCDCMDRFNKKVLMKELKGLIRTSEKKILPLDSDTNGA